MGQIAEDMLDGTCCQICGLFFENPNSVPEKPALYTHGYPVTCWDCWKELSKKERKNQEKAKVPTI